jgi:hypothetical protein
MGSGRTSSLAKVAMGADAEGIFATLLMLEMVVENEDGLIFASRRFSLNEANEPSNITSCPFALKTARISRRYLGYPKMNKERL